MLDLWNVLLVLLWIVVLIMGVLFVGLLREIGLIRAKNAGLYGQSGHNPMVPPTLPVGAQAPNFTLPKVGGGITTLNDFNGRPLLLAFVSTTCDPCKEFLPKLNAFSKHEASGDVSVLIISMGTMKENERLREEFELLPPVAVQEEMEVMTRYSTRQVPFVFLIDEGGTVRGRAIGTDYEQMEHLVASASKRSLRWVS